MAKINLKQQVVFTTAAIGIFCLLIVGVIIVPAVKQILSLKNNITETQKFLEHQYERTQRMRRSIRNLDELEEQTQKFKNTTIKEGDELKVITELEKLAVNNGVEQSLKVQKVDPKNNKGPVSDEEKKLPAILKKRPYYTFSFSSFGHFDNLVNYLKDMEKMPYYLNIDSLQFEKKKDTELVGLRFNANVYITIEEK